MRVISIQKKIWVLLFVFSLIFGFFITYAHASIYSSTLSLLINNNRAERSLNLLVLNSSLTYAAQQQADYIASSGEFGHIGYNGSTVQERTKNAGYGSYPDGMWVAESWVTGNIDQAFMTLLNQHSDQNHIFSHVWREVGIGYTQTESGLEVWVVVFGAQPGILPILINYNQEVTYERVVTVRLHNETIIQSESLFGPVVEIRIAEQDFLSEAAWQPWQSEIQLELSPEDGQKWVTAQLRDAQGRLAEAWDTIYLDQAKSFVEPAEKIEIIIDTIPAPTAIISNKIDEFFTPVATVSTKIDSLSTPVATVSTKIDATPAEGMTNSLDDDQVLVESVTNSVTADSTPIEIATNPTNTGTSTTSPIPLTSSLNDLSVAALWLTATPSILEEVLPLLSPIPSPEEELPSPSPTPSPEEKLPSPSPIPFPEEELPFSSPTPPPEEELPFSSPTPSLQEELPSPSSTLSPDATISSEPANFRVESESSRSQPDTQSTAVINQNVAPTLILTLTPSPLLNLLSVTELPTAILPKSTSVPPILATSPPIIEPSATPLLYALPTVTEYPALSSPTRWVTPTSLPMIEVTKTKSNQLALLSTMPKATEIAFNASPTSISSFMPNPTTTATPVILANVAASSSLASSSLSSPSSLSSDLSTSPASSSLFGGITIKRAIRVVTLLIIEAILLFAIGRLLFLAGIMGRR